VNKEGDPARAGDCGYRINSTRGVIRPTLHPAVSVLTCGQLVSISALAANEDISPSHTGHRHLNATIRPILPHN